MIIEQLIGVLAPEHRDVITTGGQLIIALLVYLGIRQEQGARRLRKALDAAQLAAKRSEPTGNGWAERTAQALARIEAQGTRTVDRLDNLTDRFNAHVDKDPR